MYTFSKIQSVVCVLCIIVVGCLTGRGLYTPKSIFMDKEVQNHLISYLPKYTYDECRIWVDYELHTGKSIDPNAYRIVRSALTQFDKYMVYTGWSDHGGTPGIHLDFLDHCEKRQQAANVVAKALINYDPAIKKAYAVSHSKTRENLYIGPQWHLYFYADHAPPLPQK